MAIERVTIGEHVLYCGDCLDILPTVKDGNIDFIFTDPPFGHRNNDDDLIGRREAALGRGTPGAPRPIANDGPEANQLFRATLLELRRVLDAGCCCCCCCGGGGPDPQFARWSLWMDEVLQFKQMVVWDKGPMGMGWHYRRSYETVLVGMKRGGACRWFADAPVYENILRPGDFGIRKIIPSVEQHPTEKPVELAAHFIRLHSEPGHVVLDPFMGSGTTGVACQRLGRRFIGIEIEKRYFDIACRRIQDAVEDTSLFDGLAKVEQQQLELTT